MQPARDGGAGAPSDAHPPCSSPPTTPAGGPAGRGRRPRLPRARAAAQCQKCSRVRARCVRRASRIPGSARRAGRIRAPAGRSEEAKREAAAAPGRFSKTRANLWNAHGRDSGHAGRDGRVGAAETFDAESGRACRAPACGEARRAQTCRTRMRPRRGDPHSSMSLMIDGWMPSVGSSRISSRGPMASARPMASCCCWPPERSPPRHVHHLPSTGTSRRCARDRRCRRAGGQPISRFSSTVRRGRSRALRHVADAGLHPLVGRQRGVMSRPSKEMLPLWSAPGPSGI